MDINNGSVVGGVLVPVSLRVLHGTAVILVGILGTTGNLLVIVAIATTPKLRTSHNAFVVNLSLVDLFMSVFVLIPFYAVAVLADEWLASLGSAVCRISTLFSMFLWQVSLFNLAAVAINRYLLVAKSNETYERYCGQRPIAFVLLSVWVQAAAIMLIAEFAFKVDIRYQPIFACCALNPWDPNSHRFITVVVCMAVVNGAIVMPVQYIRLYRAVRESRKRVRSAAVIVHVASADTVSLNHGRHRGAVPGPGCITKDEMRLIRMSVLLTFVFLALYLPISIIYVFGVYNPSLFRGARFCMFLLSLAPAVNPFVYALMNRNIRTACYRLIKRQRQVPA